MHVPPALDPELLPELDPLLDPPLDDPELLLDPPLLPVPELDPPLEDPELLLELVPQPATARGSTSPPNRVTA